MQRLLRTAAFVGLLASAPAAHAVTIVGTYTQDFNTLASTGTSSTVPAGWSFVEAGTSGANDGLYTANNGSSTAGDTYSYGATGSTDRALGMLQSGTLQSTIVATFTNGSANAITSLGVSYFGEQWRFGATGRADRIDFAYSLNNGATYIDFDALDFVAPIQQAVGAVDGNAVGNRALVSSSLTGLNLASGATILFRFSDFNAAGADDGLAIDDFTLTPTFAAPAVPEPASWALMIGGFGLMGGTLRRRRATAVRVAV